jgi:hypothetical protein
MIDKPTNMDAPEQERFVEELDKQRAFIDGYNKYIATNFRRAEDLTRFPQNCRPSQIRDDILQAAVVFIHATLEDFLRYIASPEAADNDRRLFGNIDRISEFLENAGIPTDEVKKLYPSLGELMRRRHQIVHRGDLKPTRNQQGKSILNEEGERDPVPIEASKVTEWSETVINFTATVAQYEL